MTHFPTSKIRLFLLGYAVVWALGLPFILIYLWHRARRDPDYKAHLGERFGSYPTTLRDAIWVHAVSLGELRSGAQLIRALLAQGDTVVITCFTPAGRREGHSQFSTEIAAGTVAVVWVPFEFDWCYRRFFRAFTPRYGLVLEVEIWPRMVAACHRAGVPLMLCNAQYTAKSVARDAKRTPILGQMMQGFTGGLVKSQLQATRYRNVGLTNLAITGELRFDQAIPSNQPRAGVAARTWLKADKRPTIAIASAVEGEDDLFAATILAMRKSDPLFIYVPRAPERFDDVADMLAAAGLRVARRSDLFDAGLAPKGIAPDIDVLLGDSLGEMYAYLAMADRAVVGGGFLPQGSHNISEPLAMGKPTIVGPYIWTIEYPAAEAIAAGAIVQVADGNELVVALNGPAPDSAEIAAFFANHSGAVEKTLAAIPRLLAAADNARP